MAWTGTFYWGPSWACYRGPSSDNVPHEYAAIQVVKSCTDQPIAINDDRGMTHEAAAIAIQPLVTHAIAPHGDVGMLFLEPQSALARTLNEFLGRDAITALPDSISAHLPVDQPIKYWPSSLSSATGANAQKLDRRIAEALEILRRQHRPNAIEYAAAEIGLSDSRLRTLVRQQLGVPLSTWLIWRKLERASLAMAKGATIAAAAYEGGFADQAHLT